MRAVGLDDQDVSSPSHQDPATWQEEADLTREYFTTFRSHLPEQLWEEHEALLERLKSAS